MDLKSLAKKILNNSYNFEKEKERWRVLVEDAKNYKKEKNKFVSRYMKGYPGHKK